MQAFKSTVEAAGSRFGQLAPAAAAAEGKGTRSGSSVDNKWFTGIRVSLLLVVTSVFVRRLGSVSWFDDSQSCKASSCRGDEAEDHGSSTSNFNRDTTSVMTSALITNASISLMVRPLLRSLNFTASWQLTGDDLEIIFWIPAASPSVAAVPPPPFIIPSSATPITTNYLPQALFKLFNCNTNLLLQ
jgi:hypothetical protein